MFVVLIIFFIGTIGVFTYLVFTYQKRIDAINKSIDEIKAKIGAVVREFNINARQDYDVNKTQQDQINQMKNMIEKQ